MKVMFIFALLDEAKPLLEALGAGLDSGKRYARNNCVLFLIHIFVKAYQGKDSLLA